MQENSLKNNKAISPSVRGSKGEALPEYNYYNPKLKNTAHKLRYRMTKAEACLWKYALRAGQMNGYNFNRQRPVMNYVADFMCKKLNLIIEVDGISHTFNGAIEKDATRQKILEEAGFTVIRFKDEEVLTQIKRVRQIIFETTEILAKQQ
ncbi:MAG TPA: DUF559 domain-containing protein [Bacteroidia bacterium]|jgi:very-short-patch-repair endonuclease|nr:DUF559 domain-containing protein [Bacteroidia bacterium]